MGGAQQNLGLALVTARKNKGLTLREVESRTGISNAYLSLLEHGRVSEPSPRYLHKLAEAYEVSYTALLELAGYPVPQEKGRGAKELRSRFAGITREEERELFEYLNFIRSRRSRKDPE